MLDNAWTRVQLAREFIRPTSQYYIKHIFPDFLEFHGDKQFADDAAIIGGIATFNGIPVTVIAQEKGADVNEKVKRNFGSPNPEGYRKSLRLMRQAEKFNRPIVCFVNTPGAYPGMEAEERGMGESIARNLMEMSDLKVPVLCILIGEGGSGGALATAVGNEVWMLENATYSILSPEGFASILWKDSNRAAEASEVMKITAADLCNLKVIEKIISEYGGADEVTKEAIGKSLRSGICEFLEKYKGVTGAEIRQERYNRFRSF